MDKETRNRIQRATQAARELLEHEYAEQLEGVFDIRLDGTIAAEPGAHLDAAQRVLRTKLVTAVEHQRAGGMTKADAVASYLREAAFTTLNRFVALKMLEAREIVQECISRVDQSAGFKEFTGLAPGLVQLPDHGYRVYIESLFDEIGREVRVLFDRRDPAALLWPRRQALLDLLAILNAVELNSIWAEDETIGWVYQYFNSDEERRQMRAESQAPRNSRELAVRNQFFTPRYVVQFLTDNTLGRIWYEMCRGNTRLRDLDYLVRRPNEVFLAEGDEPPPDANAGDEDLTHEALLQRPVHVPFRPKKDPRDLKILDPACGSGHFLLYAFDLLLTIYDEAWADEASPASEATGRTLRADYSEIEALRAAVPELILRHNLHGIDIDARCAQIAALALWMRAQRAFKDLRIPRDARPPIQRTNIVVAEPMPGEPELRREFIATLEPKLGSLVERVFDRMKLAGEVGSLLRIEDNIRDAVREIYGEHGELFRESDQERWQRAEQDVLQALHAYAEGEADGRALWRRLFAEDAAQGLGFIDLCRQRYDVVLMNPPFGEPSRPGKAYIDGRYASSSGDIFQAFVEAMLSSTRRGGRVGVLSARTGFFLGNSENWRRSVVFRNRLTCFVDLGLGVLDAALVEVAAYAIENRGPDASEIFVNRQLSTREKEPGLAESIHSLETRLDADTFLIGQDIISRVPGCVFAYWAPARLLRRYSTESLFGAAIARVRQGLATGDDFRFARLCWEVPNPQIGRQKRWQRFSKGGEYSPFFDDVHLVVDWIKDGSRLACYSGSRFQNTSFYFLPGATYTVRTASAFAAKVLPADCIFSHNAQSWFVDSNDKCLLSIAFMSCRVSQAFLELAVGAGDIATAGSAARRYTTAVVQSVPADAVERIDTPRNRELTRLLLDNRIGEFTRLETSCVFTKFAAAIKGATLRESAQRATLETLDGIVRALERSSELDAAVSAAFALKENETSFIDAEVGPHPWSYTKKAGRNEVRRLLSCSIEELMQSAVQHHGSKRWFTKKSYFVDRRIEITSHIFEASPKAIAEAAKDGNIVLDLRGFAESVVSEYVGAQ